MVKPGSVAVSAGIGLAAGLAGTAAMMASTVIEQRLGAKPASASAIQAAAKVLGVHPDGPRQRKAFGALVHAGYGSGWGLARAALGGLGLSAPAATVVHMAVLWASEEVTLPALGAIPPITRQAAGDIAVEAWNCLAYAAVTSAVYEALSGAVSGARSGTPDRGR